MTMNRLDARARLVFHYAREEADRLGHAVIESEHLLLGLLREGGTAAKVLNGAGLTLEAARHRIVELIGRFDRSRDAPPPAITALARRVMDLAGVEAARYQSSFINTGFVLLGMIHAGDGVAMGIINQTPGGTKGVRRATLVSLQLPADPEETNNLQESASSLAGIVAVPADSVLARLLNQKPILQSEPISTTLENLTEVAELPHTEVAELPHTEVAELTQTELTLEADDDIPESMLIDVAFEEVPPEEIPVEKVTIEEIVASPILEETQAEQHLEEVIEEIETPASDPVEPRLKATDEIMPNIEVVAAIEMMPDPAAKVTAEVMVNELTLQPTTKATAEVRETEMMPSTTSEIAETDSVDDLLVSDLPELLEPYQAPVLVHFALPQTDLQILETANTSTEATLDFTIAETEPLQLEPAYQNEEPELAADLSQSQSLSENPDAVELEPSAFLETPDSLLLKETATLKIASWDMVTASSMIKRQIIALGGGGFSEEPSTLLLEKYILEVASSAREVAVPRVCFVSTAAGDSLEYIKRFYNAFENLNCEASHLALFHTEDWADELEDMILGADVLYFSGGSSKNALALWQAWELEPIFKRAYEAGTVFTGVSAGAICWFEQFTTDSLGRSLGVMNGLGWLPGSFTPHYDSERFRKVALEKFLRAQKIAPGFAADDGAALHFVNGEYLGAMTSMPNAKAYHVTLGRNRLVESALETKFLG